MIIWLASYPKSGNTWLRALLAAYFFSKNGNFEFNLLKKIDQFPSVKYFKDDKELYLEVESTSKHWIKKQNIINSDKKIKFFKTHNAMCKISGNSFTNKQNTLGAIYIIRDPRNVVTSLANHYQIIIKEALEFMQDKKKAIYEIDNGSYKGFVPLLSWNLHHESWLNNKAFPILLIKYEDLCSQTFYTFKKVITFIQKLTKTSDNFNREKAKRVIKSCEFEKLKNLEEKDGFFEAVKNKNSNEKIKFFNLGKENDYNKILKKDFLEELNSKYLSELIKFNYEKSS